MLKIIGSKEIADTVVLIYDISKVDRCTEWVEASLRGGVDRLVIRILTVVGHERRESRLPLKGKGSSSM